MPYLPYSCVCPSEEQILPYKNRCNCPQCSHIYPGIRHCCSDIHPHLHLLKRKQIISEAS